MVNRESSLVSVCIPSYNHATYLPDTIESVLGQTYGNIEIIIVDDGSTDNSLAIAREYEAAHPNKIHVYTHADERNHGISATVNYALSLAKGDYWSGLPSDDMLLPEKIEKQVRYLEENREIDFVYSYAYGVDSQGELLTGQWRLLGRDISRESDPVYTLLEGNCIFGMTVLARREAIAKTGDHHQDLVCSDWEFWIRLLSHAKAGFIDEPLVKYRIHDYNTSISAAYGTQLHWIFDVLRSLRNEIPKNRQLSALNNEKYLAHIDKEIDKCLGAILGDQTSQRETLQRQLVNSEITIQGLNSTIEESNTTIQRRNSTIEELNLTIRNLGNQVAEIPALKTRIAELSNKLTGTEQSLYSFTHSRGWELLQFLWRIRGWAAPPGTLRARALTTLLTWFTIC